MQNFEHLGRELEKRGKTQQLKALADSEDGQRISRMVDQDALNAATKSGDTAALQQMLGSILRSQEGQRLAKSIEELMKD